MTMCRWLFTLIEWFPDLISNMMWHDFSDNWDIMTEDCMNKVPDVEIDSGSKILINYRQSSVIS